MGLPSDSVRIKKHNGNRDTRTTIIIPTMRFVFIGDSVRRRVERARQNASTTAACWSRSALFTHAHTKEGDRTAKQWWRRRRRRLESDKSTYLHAKITTVQRLTCFTALLAMHKSWYSAPFPWSGRVWSTKFWMYVSYWTSLCTCEQKRKNRHVIRHRPR